MVLDLRERGASERLRRLRRDAGDLQQEHAPVHRAVQLPFATGRYVVMRSSLGYGKSAVGRPWTKQRHAVDRGDPSTPLRVWRALEIG